MSNWRDKKDFKYDELNQELGYEDTKKSRQQALADLPRDYYKLPNNDQDLIKKHKLMFDYDNKLWYKLWNGNTRVIIPELNQYRWSIYNNNYLVAKAPDAQKPAIAMTALHYWPMTDDTADSLIKQSFPMKKDRKGKWYLPEYSTSGNTFHKNLSMLIKLYGDPITVILNKAK